MNALRNPWVLVALGLITNMAAFFATIFMEKGTIMPTIDLSAAEVHKGPTDKSTPEYWTFEFANYEKMLQALRDRATELDQRERDIAERKAAIAADMKALEEYRASLTTERDALTKVLKQVGAEEEKNLKVLATTYAQMPPEQVVPVFNEMPDEQVVKILLQMKTDNVGAIFAAMVASDGGQGRQAQRVAFFSQELIRYKRSGK